MTEQSKQLIDQAVEKIKTEGKEDLKKHLKVVAATLVAVIDAEAQASKNPVDDVLVNALKEKAQAALDNLISKI